MRKISTFYAASGGWPVKSRAIVNVYMMIPFAGCLSQAGPDKRLPIIETFIATGCGVVTRLDVGPCATNAQKSDGARACFASILKSPLRPCAVSLCQRPNGSSRPPQTTWAYSGRDRPASSDALFHFTLLLLARMTTTVCVSWRLEAPPHRSPVPQSRSTEHLV